MAGRSPPRMTDVAPLYGLRLRTPRLELRLGSREELLELGEVAQGGIHPPDEMPFSIAWTDRSSEPEFLDGFVAFHEAALAEWTPDDWTLNLLVWAEGDLAGSQTLGATRFAESRRVATGSWLGHRSQRRGLGTEMRAAVLELAFRGLGADVAESAWLEGNDASRRVSEKLGYREVGRSTQSPRGEPVVAHDVALERERWQCPVDVEIEGLEPCLPLFGIER
jgi:RimJ/RimL family protein N-acetyltransferase